ncbi:MAG: glycosyltransferase family A protein [Candidatus Competibacteraceae bacterium]
MNKLIAAEKPIVDIIIPVCGDFGAIKRCLDSIFACLQLETPAEIIVIKATMPATTGSLSPISTNITPKGGLPFTRTQSLRDMAIAPIWV